MPPFLPCKHCAEGKGPWCHVQGCHLVASSCSASSKGFSLRQVPDSWALLSVAPQEGCRNNSTEDPTAATWVTGALSNRF